MNETLRNAAAASDLALSLSRLRFGTDGLSIMIAESNLATAAMIDRLFARLVFADPCEIISFDIFLDRARLEIGASALIVPAGEAADWIALWNIALMGTRRSQTVYLQLGRVPGKVFVSARGWDGEERMHASPPEPDVEAFLAR